MECLQTQQLDPIPPSPALSGFDTHFGAAFAADAIGGACERGLRQRGHNLAPSH